MKQPGPQYLKTMVETASPVCNIIALYEKCLLHLTGARQSCVAGDITRKVESLRKAMDILFYLDQALDRAEPEAARPLHESYQMILAQLSLANSGNSPEALALAEKWLAGLLEAWQGISSGTGNQRRDSIPENCLPEME
jgi:flagellar biosynthetic protein FliS